MDKKEVDKPNEAGAERPPDDELTGLEVLAELELVRRKSDLFERRLAAWEEGLNEVRKRLHVLEVSRDPEQPSWQADLAGVRHRVERLERRRLRAAEQIPPASAPEGRPLAGHIPSPDDTVAIVRARWSTDRAAAGEVVTLEARTDGIDAGTALAVEIRSVGSNVGILSLPATCDGEGLEAKWRVPEDLHAAELYFEVEHRQARATSPVLVVT